MHVRQFFGEVFIITTAHHLGGRYSLHLLLRKSTMVYTETGFQYIIPPFLMHLIRKSIFLHYKNDSTLTLLRNSMFNINKQNMFFHCYKKHLKWGGGWWGNEESFSDYTTVLYGLYLISVGGANGPVIVRHLDRKIWRMSGDGSWWCAATASTGTSKSDLLDNLETQFRIKPVCI